MSNASLRASSKARLREQIPETFRDHEAIAAAFGDSPPQPPDAVVDWLTRVELLAGVPFQYLVPDEGMLPLESIRFFYLDYNWVDALFDGAFSIGRNLTTASDGAGLNLDRAVRPSVRSAAAARAGSVRAKALGLEAVPATLSPVSGFLLRSQLVSAYPTMGVNAFPKGGTPDDPTPVLLQLLRLEVLGPGSDTLLCLIDGDAVRIDVHEAAEHLHYAIDTYQTGPLSAMKMIHTFTVSDGVVTMSKEPVPLTVTSSLRAVSPRTFNMTALAAQIATLNNVTAIDSAEMGFEMTEGVGMVSFLRRNG